MRTFLLLGLLLLTGCAQTTRLAAPDTPREVVVSKFVFNIEGLETEHMGEAEGILPTFLKIREAVAAARDVVEVLRDPESSPFKAATDALYHVAAADFRRDLNLHLLPLDALRGQEPYFFGYPMASAERVARRGDYEHAMEIAAEVSFPSIKRSDIDLIVWGKSKVKGRPVLTLHVKMVDRDGRVVWRDKSRVRSRQEVMISDTWILGMKSGTDVRIDASLHDMMTEAVARLVQKAESR